MRGASLSLPGRPVLSNLIEVGNRQMVHVRQDCAMTEASPVTYNEQVGDKHNAMHAWPDNPEQHSMLRTEMLQVTHNKQSVAAAGLFC